MQTIYLVLYNCISADCCKQSSVRSYMYHIVFFNFQGGPLNVASYFLSFKKLTVLVVDRGEYS